MLGERPTEEHRHAATAAIDVSITMLGEFAIQIDNRRIGLEAFERRGAAELVQLLAMQPGRRLHRERVLDALWPGVPADRISNHLHKAASYARKALELSKAIVLRSEHVSLLPNHKVAVDVDVLLAVDHNDPASLTTARSVYRREVVEDKVSLEPDLLDLHMHLAARLADFERRLGLSGIGDRLWPVADVQYHPWVRIAVDR
jgi:DNA-binding SARP family transcriptional activator